MNFYMIHIQWSYFCWVYKCIMTDVLPLMTRRKASRFLQKYIVILLLRFGIMGQ